MPLPPRSLTSATRRDLSAGLPALAAWHAGWAAAAALLALAARWIGTSAGLPVDGPLTFACLAMILPGLAGLALLWRDGWRERMLVLGAWSLATLAASALTGGLTGTLAPYVFMPLAAGIALGGWRLTQAGALVTALAAIGGLMSVTLVGPGLDVPGLAATSAVLVATAVAVAARLSWHARETALEQALAIATRTERLLASQPGLTLIVNPNGDVLAAYGNAPPALSVDPLFEQGLISAVHAPDRASVMSAMERAMAGHEAQVVFAPRAALDRRVTLILRRMTPTPNGQPGDDRLIAQAFDGTARFAHEMGLETARAEAEAHNAGKTRFLANMSHELRTPLNAVLGFSDIMRQRIFGPLPAKYADYATSIHAAGQHLLDLINDVLDVSKIEAERYELSLERFDAREVVSAAIALIRVSATDKGVSLNGLLPSETLSVNADRRALTQITLNLLSNAIKFTPSGGAVTVTLEAVGPQLEIVVADTGVGIALEDLRRLGRPFEQAGGADQRAQGTGLGLSLVRALAELHGGQMTIDSTLGEGAAVTVRLPVATPATVAL